MGSDSGTRRSTTEMNGAREYRRGRGLREPAKAMLDAGRVLLDEKGYRSGLYGFSVDSSADQGKRAESKVHPASLSRSIPQLKLLPTRPVPSPAYICRRGTLEAVEDRRGQVRARFGSLNPAE